METAGDGPLRRPELIAALTLGMDLGLGQPTEHVLRTCLLSLRLGERVGAAPADLEIAYHVALLSAVGCTADSSEIAEFFGDDIEFRGAAYRVDLAGMPLFGFMLRHAGAGGSPWHRVRIAAALVAEGTSGASESMAGHCELAATLADRLGLGPDLHEPMRQIFARWDGKGEPGLKRDEIALAVRLVQVADIVEAHRSAGGPEPALAVARKRAGGQFDPAIVAELERHADELFDGLDGATTWDDVVDAEPTPTAPIDEDELDEALTVVADFADIKSPYFRGHSRGVAALAGDAASQLALSPTDVALVRRAGLVHDLGRTGVPNSIWDKPGPLTEAERERVRLHPYYTERALARPAALARLGVVAGAHHERLDGSGYHRGLGGSALPPTSRVLAAADAYHAMTEPRPHRPALGPATAAEELRVGREIDMADPRQVTAENVAAVKAHDAERLRATYARDVVAEAPDAKLEGADAITDYVRMWTTAFPDMRQTIVNELVAGDWVVSEFTVAGTHTGMLASPDGDIPPTNRRATGRGVQLQRVENGKIAEEHVYFDQLEILTQLGLIPEPATA